VAAVRVYFAARYSRRGELLEYRPQLERTGIAVTSGWVLGGHQAGTGNEHMPADRVLMARLAEDDYGDLMAADVVVSFTEPPRTPSTNRGVRHVEHGIALAAGKRVLVVGHIENVFHALPGVEFHREWGSALRELAAAVADPDATDVNLLPASRPGARREAVLLTPRDAHAAQPTARGSARAGRRSAS
jgi:hypothetical protein